MSTNKKNVQKKLLKSRQRKLEPRNCVRAEVAVPGHPSQTVRKTMVSVDVKHKATPNLNKTETVRAQELCGSRGGRPGLPVPNNPYGLCGQNEALKD